VKNSAQWDPGVSFSECITERWVRMDLRWSIWHEEDNRSWTQLPRPLREVIGRSDRSEKAKKSWYNHGFEFCHKLTLSNQLLLRKYLARRNILFEISWETASKFKCSYDTGTSRNILHSHIEFQHILREDANIIASESARPNWDADRRFSERIDQILFRKCWLSVSWWCSWFECTPRLWEGHMPFVENSSHCALLARVKSFSGFHWPFKFRINTRSSMSTFSTSTSSQYHSHHLARRSIWFLKASLQLSENNRTWNAQSTPCFPDGTFIHLNDSHVILFVHDECHVRPFQWSRPISVGVIVGPFFFQHKERLRLSLSEKLISWWFSCILLNVGHSLCYSPSRPGQATFLVDWWSVTIGSRRIE
jgi:hypothetical protein